MWKSLGEVWGCPTTGMPGMEDGESHGSSAASDSGHQLHQAYTKGTVSLKIDELIIHRNHILPRMLKQYYLRQILHKAEQ